MRTKACGMYATLLLVSLSLPAPATAMSLDVFADNTYDFDAFVNGIIDGERSLGTNYTTFDDLWFEDEDTLFFFGGSNDDPLFSDSLFRYDVGFVPNLSGANNGYTAEMTLGLAQDQIPVLQSLILGVGNDAGDYSGFEISTFFEVTQYSDGGLVGDAIPQAFAETFEFGVRLNVASDGTATSQYLVNGVASPTFSARTFDRNEQTHFTVLHESGLPLGIQSAAFKITLAPSSVPLPATLPMLLVALFGTGLLLRRPERVAN